MSGGARAGVTLVLVGALAGVAACTDVSAFAGRWSGPVVAEPTLLAGLPPSAEGAVQIEAADRTSMRGSATVAGETVTLRPMVKAANDTLGAVELPDAPLRSYWMVAPLASGDAVAVVSLYADDHVDLRVLRGDALYAVFHLRR